MIKSAGKNNFVQTCETSLLAPSLIKPNCTAMTPVKIVNSTATDACREARNGTAIEDDMLIDILGSTVPQFKAKAKLEQCLESPRDQDAGYL